MKKIVLFLLGFSSCFLFAQKETLATSCYLSDIENYLETKSIYSDVYKDMRRPDMIKAAGYGWDAFTEVYSMESLPVSVIWELFEPEALKKINSTMGNIGNGLALIQISADYLSGNTLAATSNAIKSGMFYVIGEYGWKSLKVAGVGLQVFDYMLTYVGESVVGARQEALREAYFDYYERSTGRRDLKTWKSIITDLQNAEEVEKEIRNYLDRYFQITDDEINKKLSGGLYTKDEIDEVKKQYLQERLLPYLNPLFLALQKEAKEEQTGETRKSFQTVAERMNEYKRYRIHLNAPEETRVRCKAGIEILTQGNWKLFVHGTFDDKGRCELSFTRYSLVVHHVDSLRAVLRCEGTQEPLYRYQALKKRADRSDIYFDLPADSPQENSEQKESTVADTETDITENQPAITKKTEAAKDLPVFSAKMRGIFTANHVPAEVKLQRIRENDKEFVASVSHAKIPRNNTLTVNKLTGEFTFIYKLSGPFAPELICSGVQIAPLTYGGMIRTNNAASAEVGPFSFIFLK